MFRRFALAFLLTVIVLDAKAATRRRAVQPSRPLSWSFDFRAGAQGWEAGFTDYSRLTSDLRLDSGIVPLPSEIGAGTGFLLTGANRSDDLFMFLRRRLGPEDGITPDTDYLVNYYIVVASNAQSGCGGIGGAPGESVYLKAGASSTKPEAILEGDDYRLNVDKGNQAQDGPAASLVGNIANGIVCDLSDAPFVSLVRSHRHTTVVRSSNAGELWLLVGTDSGFEGTTTLYYQRINASLSFR